MAYDFEERFNRLATRMRELNKRTVDIYRNDIEEFADVEVTCYELAHEELLHYGISTDIRRRDYIITAADVIDYEPQIGDEIRDGSLVCEVAKLGDIAHWKYTSHNRVALRIHTVVTGE